MDNDAIIKRLEKLEQEVAAIRQELRMLTAENNLLIDIIADGPPGGNECN